MQAMATFEIRIHLEFDGNSISPDCTRPSQEESMGFKNTLVQMIGSVILVDELVERIGPGKGTKHGRTNECQRRILQYFRRRDMPGHRLMKC